MSGGASDGRPAAARTIGERERDGERDGDGDGREGVRGGTSAGPGGAHDTPAEGARGGAGERGPGDSRRAILERIGAALAPGRDATLATLADRPAAVAERLGGTRRHTLPRVEGDLESRLVENMEAVLMSVVRLQRPDEVPAAVAFWLESEGIAGDVSVAPALAGLGWPTGEGGGRGATGVADGRRWRVGAASGDETVGVTPCLAAVAETGSVALASGPGTPATLAFLPENHVVVLRSDDVVAHVEDVFPRLRALGTLPRALNFVTGPSRTADIEQTIEIGAHGPRRMHVLIVPGEDRGA